MVVNHCSEVGFVERLLSKSNPIILYISAVPNSFQFMYVVPPAPSPSEAARVLVQFTMTLTKISGVSLVSKKSFGNWGH